MKKLSRMLMVTAAATVIFTIGCSPNKVRTAAESSTAESSLTTNIEDHVEVLYFHGKMRCLTCRAIEKFAQETVDSLSHGEKESGKVLFRVIDIEKDPELADSYQTTGSSLFVTSYKDGKENRKDLTEFGFRTARRNHQVFQDSLTTVIRQSLNMIGS